MVKGYAFWQFGPVAKITTNAGFSPNIVAVLAFDGVVLGDLSIPCEMFKRIRGPQGEARYEVRVCSAQPEVQTEHAQLRPPYRLASLHRASLVVIPGLDDLQRTIPAPIISALVRAHARGARLASICTGAFILAKTGLLDGKRATTHWLAVPELARRHPQIEVDADVLYVDNDRVLSSAGAAAGLDLCLHLIRKDLGARAAAQAAKQAVMPLERAGGQAQFIDHPPPEGDETLQPLLDWLIDHLDEPHSLQRLARRAKMSPRTLSRRFRAQIGTTPAKWLTQARLRKAQQLLETSELSIEQIAEATGYSSAAILRERFGKSIGTSPRAYRRAFGAPNDRRATQ